MYLNKILPLFFSPIVVVLGLILASVIFRKRVLALLAAALLLVASIPVVADRALLMVQGDFVRLRPTDVPRHETVVVLAGSVDYTRGRSGPMPDWGSTVDRVLAGIELMRAARAERVIFSSGKLLFDGVPSEGEQARDLALAMGVSDARIVLSAAAENTADEARLIRPLFAAADAADAAAAPAPRPAIILVTSANHMPRASLIFRAAGFDVTPYPVDIDMPQARRWHDRWLPDARALLKTDTAIRELLGQGYYRLIDLLA